MSALAICFHLKYLGTLEQAVTITLETTYYLLIVIEIAYYLLIAVEITHHLLIALGKTHLMALETAHHQLMTLRAVKSITFSNPLKMSGELFVA